MWIILYVVGALCVFGGIYQFMQYGGSDVLLVAGGVAGITWFAFGRLIQLAEDLRDSLRAVQKAVTGSDGTVPYDEMGQQPKIDGDPRAALATLDQKLKKKREDQVK